MTDPRRNARQTGEPATESLPAAAPSSIAPADGGAATSPPAQLPPDPAAYDHPRAELARARGLETPYIPGGQAPDAESARREERTLARVLLVMVVVIVLAGFVLGALANLVPAG